MYATQPGLHIIRFLYDIDSLLCKKNVHTHQKTSFRNISLQKNLGQQTATKMKLTEHKKCASV